MTHPGCLFGVAGTPLENEAWRGFRGSWGFSDPIGGGSVSPDMGVKAPYRRERICRRPVTDDQTRIILN